LAGTAPYNVMLGLGYNFDLRPPPEPEVVTREVIVEEEVQQERDPTGRIRGTVYEEGTDTIIAGARVRYPARTLNEQVAGPDGRFVSDEFPPEEAVDIAVSHPDYEGGTCSGQIGPEAEDAEVRCEMARPSRVIVEETEVTILEQINFALDRWEIDPSSFGLMDEIAETLNAHPEILRVEIQGHTDNQGTAQYNLILSNRRANSVRQGLVDRGVDTNRLVSRGYGLTQPLVDNDTPENRARNRRVQFIIQDRTDGSPETVETE
ncbi:MAG: OmpA family protein, partial [Myxococcota bacterium]